MGGGKEERVFVILVFWGFEVIDTIFGETGTEF
jgi:hypothetical protein